MNELTQLAKPKDGPAPRWFHIAVAASMVLSAVSALIATIHTRETMTALVEQNAKNITLFQKHSDRFWLQSDYIEGESLHLTTLDFDLSVDEVYQGVDFTAITE